MNDLDRLIELEFKLMAAKYAKTVDQQILELIAEEAKEFEQFMLDDSLFEI